MVYILNTYLYISEFYLQLTLVVYISRNTIIWSNRDKNVSQDTATRLAREKEKLLK